MKRKQKPTYRKRLRKIDPWAFAISFYIALLLLIPFAIGWVGLIVGVLAK